jgi:MFS family permease
VLAGEYFTSPYKWRKYQLQPLLVGSTASTYNMGFPTMTRDLHCTEFQASIGLAVYALGFGVFPLVTTSFSEEIGRRPLYIGSLIGHILMHLTIAL